MKIYAVFHNEYFKGRRLDEMLFHICSSLKKAEVYMKESKVDSYSWWEVQEFELDEPEWGKHVAYYNHRGTKMKSKQQFEDAVTKAKEAYKKKNTKS